MQPQLSPAPARVLETLTDEETQTGKPDVAHIVKTDKDKTATSAVLEARVYGTPLEALCGEVFVPQKDPTKLPMCGACKEVYELYRSMNDGLGETPDA